MENVDHLIKELLDGSLPCLDTLNQIVDLVIPLFLSAPNVIFVSSPCLVVGDLHGQFFDFLLLLQKVDFFARPRNIVFLGDIVDRGYYSTECLMLVLLLKLRFPDKVTLLRGNHESKQITQVYGFYDELKNRFGNLAGCGPTFWRRCVALFDVLPIAAIVDGEIFCAHGGIPRECPSLLELSTTLRFGEVPFSGPICDLLWSDPKDNKSDALWEPNVRGAGISFSETLLKSFLHKNGLNKMFRSHQLVMEGLRKQFDSSLVTVWSAPNYCYRCGNLASVAEIDAERQEHFTVFGAAPNEERKTPDLHTRFSLLEEV